MRYPRCFICSTSKMERYKVKKMEKNKAKRIALFLLFGRLDSWVFGVSANAKVRSGN